MDKSQQFDIAFMPVEHLADGIANVTDNGIKLLVQPGYCAHCRDIEDGIDWCVHKEAAFGEDDAQDQYETYRDALEVPDLDSRREAYYQAGHYPPKHIR